MWFSHSGIIYDDKKKKIKKKNDLLTNSALHYLDKDFGFGGNALDESAEIKVKKKLMFVFGLLAKKKGKKSKNNTVKFRK